MCSKLFQYLAPRNFIFFIIIFILFITDELGTPGGELVFRTISPRPHLTRVLLTFAHFAQRAAHFHPFDGAVLSWYLTEYAFWLRSPDAFSLCSEEFSFSIFRSVQAQTDSSCQQNLKQNEKRENDKAQVTKSWAT